jgi:hypothetical protein
MGRCLANSVGWIPRILVFSKPLYTIQGSDGGGELRLARLMVFT